MSRTGLIFLILSALLTVASNLLLRTGIARAGGFTPDAKTFFSSLLELLMQPFFVAGVFFYGFAALLWFRVLSTELLSIAYPLLVSITFIFVTAGAVLLFKESMNASKAIGMAMIVFGIFIVARDI